MSRFIALLRGVNVGKAKRVPMGELRTLLEGLGYTGVITLLNSGNVVFDAAAGSAVKHAAAIAAAIAGQLKVEVQVIVKSAQEFSSIVAGNPLRASAQEHSRLLVAFVQDAKSLASMTAIAALVVAPERFAVAKNAAYLLCARGILESKAAAALLGEPGRVATSRNWATVLKLEEICSRP